MDGHPGTQPGWVEKNGPLMVMVFWVLFFVSQREQVLPLLRVPMFWFLSSLLLYWFILSGTHWNMILGAPLLIVSQSGGLQLFLHGYGQTMIEGWIMATLFLGGGLAWIGLTVWVPQETDFIKRMLRFIVFAATWILFFSWVVFLYVVAKNPRYDPLFSSFLGN